MAAPTRVAIVIFVPLASAHLSAGFVSLAFTGGAVGDIASKVMFYIDKMIQNLSVRRLWGGRFLLGVQNESGSSFFYFKSLNKIYNEFRFSTYF